MAELNSTPNANRLHIGIFGRTNSGKSSLINLLTGQKTSIVSEVAGTTTDPVYKAMEIHPLGACVIIDTPGIEDSSSLGAQRLEKTKLAMEKTDVAVLVFAANYQGNFEEEYKLLENFQKKKVPVLCLVNSFGNQSVGENLKDKISERLHGDSNTLLVADCSESGGGGNRSNIIGSLSKLMPEDYDEEFITGTLVKEDDLVLLVMPQDIQAPKRRLILPQVQTIRELLDRKCTVVSTTTDRLELTLDRLKEAPQLIITDSQAFKYVYEHKPRESSLTSFSVLFAAYKGDLKYYVEGAHFIDQLDEKSRVLIAECCTHAPLTEDIGRVKIPRLLHRRFGEGLQVDVVSGTDFPDDLTKYDLVIQCGGCMFNRRYILSRIQRAKDVNVPMTNYGVTIAHLTGILDKIVM
ncbi:[FeFe] hydrogenase H-cluster maturation GTPase HydF [Anaerovibrio lipolyticus]|uniref:[FeFe] hydrogenase H-cluster maturation GTPase HydF n=1 Tax=Anaerovibrio lipolyticus TaxID=82374 RepID=UPI0026F1F178|nr:[FeFe] hydrogenase H-cluster maturation GTPase HydF [Anaerovibrio lipolyticus]MBE6105869.1 [FeFe] hydrogenase H-cluster maturation GTPase HydF [Anaerovibrio lipolyticus]